MATKQLDYTQRDFLGIKNEILNYAKTFYGDEFSIFLSDSSVGSMLVDLLAATGDILSVNTDKVFNETQLSYAKEERNIYQLAKNLGLNLPNKRASVTLAEITVTVPVRGSSFDSTYTPILRAGTQVVGGGKSFELLGDLDFNNPLSDLGTPNRKIIPNVNSNNDIVSYNISKIEPVYNGITKIYSQVVRQRDSKPFLSIFLPDNDVLEINSIIVKAGELDVLPEYNEFFDENLLYYEVPFLVEPYVFTEDLSGVPENNVKVAKIKKVTKKFIKEFTPNGFCKITFGGGDGSLSNFDDAISAKGFNPLYGYLTSTAMGKIIPPNSTIFVKYRVGGGASSNIGANVIDSFGTVYFSIDGTREDIKQQIRRSLSVTNIIPAFGGSDKLSVEQIRYLASYNFGSQNRCVTLTDYLTKTYLMPGKYGSPFKVNAIKEDNKVVILVIGLDSNNKLNNTNISLLEDNISLWLSQFRMVNDYVEVRNGRIINLGYNITVLVDNNVTNASIATEVINAVYEFHNINKINMGDDLLLGGLIENITNVGGVLNVMDFKIYNKVGGKYSLNETNMSYIDNKTRQIDISDYTLYSDPDSMFEIKYPENDIIINVMKRKSTKV
jgi:hypothetical protein